MAIDDSEDRHVSWMHARIECDGDATRIRDFRSKNGTYVNKEPVDGTRPLQIGDTIQLGRKGPKLIVLELDIDRDDALPVPPPFIVISSAPVGLFRHVKAWGLQEGRWIVVGSLTAAIMLLLLLVNMAWRGDREIAQDPPPSHEKVEGVGGSPESLGKKAEDNAAPQSGPKVTKDKRPSLPPVLTTEELKKRYSGAVVWLGAEFDKHRLPLCSGFAVDRTKIICTAREIVQLKRYQQEGKPVFVYSEGCSPKFLRVVDLKVHPAYDQKNPTCSESLLHNVGVAIVGSPLPDSVDLLPSRELPGPPKDMKVTVAGYSIQYEPELKPYDPLDPPKQVWPRGQVRGTKTFSGGGDELPVLELAISVADGTDGGPVFSDAGKVIGVLLRYGDQRYVVLSDQLFDLIR